MSALLSASLPLAATPATSFEIKGSQFLRDGKPHLIRSGAIHYPRGLHPYWRDRLKMAKGMGPNTSAAQADLREWLRRLAIPAQAHLDEGAPVDQCREPSVALLSVG